MRKCPIRAIGYTKALAHFVKETDGRAFVLFTGNRGMQQLAEEIQSFFAENGMNLFVQGQGRRPRGKLREPLLVRLSKSDAMAKVLTTGIDQL